MADQCAVPLVSREEYGNRNEIARNLWEEVNAGSYSPARLHGFLSAPKANNVARFVPVLSCRDTSVYFACVKQVDEALASQAVTDTFGGWQLGGARRSIEEAEALKMFGGEDSLSIPQSCYNRGAWIKNWNQFWKLLAARHEDAGESAWFAMFDIANFYDSIDLRRLETAVRATGTGAQFALNVLFHLLRSWNRAHCLYADSAKGLPMDVVGDCSRLLANYFLTPFDRAFRERMNRDGGDYMRFADDMVVRASNLSECEASVYEASDRLHRLGLNINVAKVTYCSKDKFDKYWGFVVMDRFESGDILEALTLLRSHVADDDFGRKTTALKRAVTLASRLDESNDSRWWKGGSVRRL